MNNPPNCQTIQDNFWFASVCWESDATEGGVGTVAATLAVVGGDEVEGWVEDIADDGFQQFHIAFRDGGDVVDRLCTEV